jgi:hypothetical protein
LRWCRRTRPRKCDVELAGREKCSQADDYAAQ